MRAGNTGVHGFKMNEADQAKFKNVLSTDDAALAKPSGNNRENKLMEMILQIFYSSTITLIYHMHGNVREWSTITLPSVIRNRWREEEKYCLICG